MPDRIRQKIVDRRTCPLGPASGASGDRSGICASTWHAPQVVRYALLPAVADLVNRGAPLHWTNQSPVIASQTLHLLVCRLEFAEREPRLGRLVHPLYRTEQWRFQQLAYRRVPLLPHVSSPRCCAFLGGSSRCGKPRTMHWHSGDGFGVGAGIRVGELTGDPSLSVHETVDDALALWPANRNLDGFGVHRKISASAMAALTSTGKASSPRE